MYTEILPVSFHLKIIQFYFSDSFLSSSTDITFDCFSGIFVFHIHFYRIYMNDNGDDGAPAIILIHL